MQLLYMRSLDSKITNATANLLVMCDVKIFLKLFLSIPKYFFKISSIIIKCM